MRGHPSKRWAACLLASVWASVYWLLAWPSSSLAQTCAQKAVLTASADIYRETPRYVTGLGWQGPRTERLAIGTLVWVCQERAVDFGFSSRVWTQIGYRLPSGPDPWRFGWIMKSQWKAVVNMPGGTRALRPAAYAIEQRVTQADTQAEPPATMPMPKQPASADEAPTVPPPKGPSINASDAPPESAKLGDQIVLYGPLFIAMLLGMIAKALFDLLDDNKPSWREHMRHGAMAIVVSPIVFLGFITAGQFNSSSQTFLVLALFAFQNGFFWQTVLKRHGGGPSSADSKPS